MGCFGVTLGLVTPRFVMVILWIFTSYLGRAYDSTILPLLGFFFLPTTTLAYAVAQNETNGIKGWGALVMILGIGLDLGIWGSGRGAFSKG
jgi:hypothetical protein